MAFFDAIDGLCHKIFVDFIGKGGFGIEEVSFGSVFNFGKEACEATFQERGAQYIACIGGISHFVLEIRQYSIGVAHIRIDIAQGLWGVEIAYIELQEVATSEGISNSSFGTYPVLHLQGAFAIRIAVKGVVVFTLALYIGVVITTSDEEFGFFEGKF